MSNKAVGGAGAVGAVGGAAAVGEPVSAFVTFSDEVAMELLGKLFPSLEEKDMVVKRGFIKKGVLSDPGIVYYFDTTKEKRDGDKSRISIEVLSDTKGDTLGGMEIDVDDKDMKLIDITATTQGKGLGSRMMAALVDIAHRSGRTTLFLDSLPAALGFYLQLNPPFEFENSSNAAVYSAALENAKKTQTEKNAIKTASSAFKELVPLKKNIAPKNRSRKNRKRRSRKNR